jgi:Ca2+/H+ antiporter, TMEM165/GDT1 family
MRRRFSGRKILGIILMVLVGVTVFSGAVMLLWNNVLAHVVAVSTITFWQALGLLALSKILFGGFRGGHWGRHEWKKGMMQRWDSMSAEDKEKFKSEWENRCGRRFGRSFREEKAEQ